MLKKIEFNDLPEGLGIEKLIGLIAQCRPVGRITDYPNTQDLHELLALEEVRVQTIVWLDDASEAQAFCILDPYNNLLFDCADIANYSFLFTSAVEFCNQIIKENNNGKKDYPTLDVCCWGDDHQRIECLKNEGFIRESIESVYFKRPLKEVLRSNYFSPRFSYPTAGRGTGN